MQTYTWILKCLNSNRPLVIHDPSSSDIADEIAKKEYYSPVNTKFIELEIKFDRDETVSNVKLLGNVDSITYT